MTRTIAGSPARTLLTVAAGVLLVAGVPLLVAACGTSDSSPGAVASLEGKVWTATQIDGVAEVLPADETASTAKFVDGTVAGSGGVNSYSGAYVASDDGTLEIQRPVSTLMAGPPAANEQETAFFAALIAAETFAVEGETLKLFGPDEKLLATFVETQPVPLTGTTWSALAYNNGRGALQSLAADSEITAVFGDDDSLTGNASINTYSTTFAVEDDGSMTVSPQIAATQMAGPEELMEQEQAYLAALPLTATYSIEGDDLWLRDAEGAALAHYVAK